MSVRNRVSQFLGFIVRSLLWAVHIGLFFYTVFIYYLLGRLPSEHWFASLLMISLPVAWLGLAGIGVVWLFFRPWRALLSVAGLLLGFWLWPRTFSLHIPDTDEKPTLTLLSYNVSVFVLEKFYEHKHVPPQSTQLIDWMVRHPAPVKCLQEFYTGEAAPAYRVQQRLDSAGYRYHVYLQPMNEGYIGVATFSKYPILAQGRQVFGSFNGMVWTDIKVGTDTIRFINVHLQSMGIRVRRVFEKEEMNAMKAETRTVLGALKAGFVARRREVRLIETVIAQSPHPVIVAGDFNDTPYSVVYEHMRHRLNNAFEDAGAGFGFTLNRAPRFIRIDNQFYDAKHLKAVGLKVYRNMPYSDHFPVEGRYVRK